LALAARQAASYAANMSQFTPTERTKVRRKPDRANYDREAIYRILDEAFVCQVGFVSKHYHL